MKFSLGGVLLENSLASFLRAVTYVLYLALISSGREVWVFARLQEWKQNPRRCQLLQTKEPLCLGAMSSSFCRLL